MLANWNTLHPNVIRKFLQKHYFSQQKYISTRKK